MESRKGPKFRKKKKKKGDDKTLAERIMQAREDAAQEAERNSSKSQESNSQETGPGPKTTPQATPKDLSEAANTPGSEGHLSPSESVDISHLTKDSDQKKRTPTPEPTLSASHFNQLPGPSSGQKPCEDSPVQTKDNKAQQINSTQTSYQQPLQPAYAPYIPENSLSDQSKSQQKPQHPQQKIPPENGVNSEVGRNIPVTSNHSTTITCADTTATTTITTTTTSPLSSSLSSSTLSSSVKDLTHISTNSSSIPTGVAAGRETNPVQQQPNALAAHPQTPNSDYNKYMSLAQKIVLQRKIVAVCDSVTRQQPQPNLGFELNPERIQETEGSTLKEDNQLLERQIQNTAPWIPVSCQEPCPLSDKKCPIHSTRLKNSLERNRDSNQQGNFTTRQNLSEYSTTGISGKRESPSVDNQLNNAANTTTLATESKNADQTPKPINQTRNQQPVLRNGFLAQNPPKVYMLPKDPVNEDLDLVNNFELEALEKMVDHDLQSLVSGTSADENTPVINKDLRNKVLSEEFQRKIDRFLHDI